MNAPDPYSIPSRALPPTWRGSAEDPRSGWTRLWFYLGWIVLGWSLLLGGLFLFGLWRSVDDPHGWGRILCILGLGGGALPMACIGITAIVKCRRPAS
ncbi:hypothetical protein [Agrilutibacter solisilvae]|uniref:Uncharacterized protein n=1 Tax=Agrilutibacter solisilvae TaxID=2763317 RepID=A0A974Y1L9_9GAMM|nr:hypothetical protein [Lysobacter solisilvae]QSX79757.1 hypothetical protein I8J32_007965 [Lysobacter solisilvae]